MLNNLVFCRKLKKFQDKEFAQSALGHRRPLEQWRVPHLRLPLTWVLEARASKQTRRASAPQWISLKRRGREREKERERESTQGEPDFQETSSRSWSEKLVHPLLSGKAFYTFGCTQRSMDNTKLCSISSPDSYQDQFLSAYLAVYTSLR